MRRLTILRHAKSSWDDASLSDFDRPLNRRGERDAPEMGRRLRERGIRPSLIVSSDAQRAFTTASIIAREIGYPQEFIQREHELYHASPADVIDVLIDEAGDFNDVLVVGHNPGLTNLANRLGDIRFDNIPTCGVVAIDLEVSAWSELHDARGTTAWFDYPKKRRDRK